MIATLEYEPHELAKMFPDSTPDEKSELLEHIRKYGQQAPCILYEGKVLDGRSRQEQCAVIGVKPLYAEFNRLPPHVVEAGPLEYVIGRNLVRRHYSASQRAMIAAELIPKMEKALQAERLKAQTGTENGEPAKRGRPSTGGKLSERAAKTLGVSTRSVESARRVLKKSPEKAAAIKAGTLTVGKASMDPAAAQRMTALEAAHMRIEKVCGKELADAARNKLRLKRARDALAFAGQTDAEMRSQAGLIELGWPLRKARLYKPKNLTKRSKVDDLLNKAASSGMSLDIVIDGWRISVTRATSALKY